MYHKDSREGLSTNQRCTSDLNFSQSEAVSANVENYRNPSVSAIETIPWDQGRPIEQPQFKNREWRDGQWTAHLLEANMVIELSMPHAAISATSMHLEKRSHQCYSITDNVNGLHIRLVCHTCVVGERRHRGSITGRNDASYFIVMENMSQFCRA